MPAYRRHTAGFTASATHTRVKPSGLAVGDLMVFFVFYDSGSTFTVDTLPDGFQQIPGVQIDDNYAWADAYWKIATQSDVEASSFSVVYTAGASGGSALVAFSGIDNPSAPFRDTGYGRGSGTNISVNPGIDCESGDLLVGYWFNLNTYTASSYATQYQNPSSWTERFEATSSSRAHSFVDGVASGSGATGNWTCTQTGTGGMGVIALALKGAAIEQQVLDPFGMTGFFGA